jgi:hypothetical protein
MDGIANDDDGRITGRWGFSVTTDRVELGRSAPQTVDAGPISL